MKDKEIVIEIIKRKWLLQKSFDFLIIERVKDGYRVDYIVHPSPHIFKEEINTRQINKYKEMKKNGNEKLFNYSTF